MELHPRQLNRATLARQLLLSREDLDVAEGVRRVVALQAQEPASPYIALWNRLADLDPTEVDGAFAEQTIVKATLMRITLHAVCREDYADFHEAMLPNLRAARLGDRRFTSTGLTVDEADALVPKVVAYANESRSRAQIEAMLADELGAEADKGIWWALRTFSPLVHHPTAAPWSFDRRPWFVAAPDGARSGPTTSLQHLLRRYLAGFGPASVADIAQFSLQKRTVIRTALEGLQDELSTYDGPNGHVLFDVEGGEVPDPDVPAPPRLLGMWDSVLLAYDDRSRVLPPEYRSSVIRRNGDVLPTLLVDGHVAGVWRASSEGIEAHAFHRMSDEVWEGLVEEGRRVRGFLAERDPAPYRRYDRWWEQRAEGETRVLVR